MTSYTAKDDEEVEANSFYNKNLLRGANPNNKDVTKEISYGPLKKAYIYYFRPSKPEAEQWVRSEIMLQIANKHFAEGERRPLSEMLTSNITFRLERFR